jgi:hypothetical protein
LRGDRSVVVVCSDGLQLSWLIREFTIAVRQGRGPGARRAVASSSHLDSSQAPVTDCTSRDSGVGQPFAIEALTSVAPALLPAFGAGETHD